METNCLQVYYANYNSIINDGHRVRRMRRTELSAEKIRNSSAKKEHINNYFSNEKPVTKQSSLAKVEPRTKNKGKNDINQNVIQSVQNEYYNLQKVYAECNRLKYASAPREHSRVSNKRQESSSNKSKNMGFSRQSSSFNKEQQSLHSSMRNSKLYKQGSLDPYNIQKSVNSKASNKGSFRSRKSTNHLSPNIANFPPDQSKFNSNSKINSKSKSSISSVSQKPGKKSFVRSQIKKSEGELKNSHDLDQYGFRQQNTVRNPHSKIKHSSNYNSNQGSKIKQNDSHINISHYSKLQISKRSSQGKDKKSLVKEPSAFKEVEQIFSKQNSNLGGEPLSNISKVKLDQLVNPIINSSSAKKQSWKEAINSLTQLGSQLKEQQSQSQHQNTKNDYQSKKLSLQIDSMREDNFSATENKLQSSHKNTWRNLPLTSRQPSRKSFDSMSSKVQPGSLRNLIECVEMHNFLVDIIEQFKEETQNQKQQGEDVQILCFLLDKKHFLEKTNILKALKGGKNIFWLSTLQIQNNFLKQHAQSQQILRIVKDLDVQNRQLFKKLQSKYLQIKPRLKKNPYFKLETPQDTFSKQIVRILQIELDDLSDKLKNNPNEQLQQEIQYRIFTIMEMVFLLSQLGGRIVKKIQFYEDVDHFEDYFNQNQQALIQTFQYFKSLK